MHSWVSLRKKRAFCLLLFIYLFIFHRNMHTSLKAHLRQRSSNIMYLPSCIQIYTSRQLCKYRKWRQISRSDLRRLDLWFYFWCPLKKFSEIADCFFSSSDSLQGNHSLDKHSRNNISQIISHSRKCWPSFFSWLKPQNCALDLKDFSLSCWLLNLCQNNIIKNFPDKTGFWSIQWISALQC